MNQSTENGVMDVLKSTVKIHDIPLLSEAHDINKAVYELTRRFPPGESMGISSQIRQTALNLAVNIAKGRNHSSTRYRINAFNESKAYLEELKYCLTLAADLDYGQNPNLISLMDEVDRLLGIYIKSTYNNLSLEM